MRPVQWVAAALLLLATAVTAMAAAKQMSVTVKETEVRATPGYLGKVLGTVVYGDRVTLLDQPANAPKGWVMIQAPDGKKGWVNLSALTEKEVKLASSTGVQQEAASGDVALAGKGFNSDVEAEYEKEQKLDYTWVDKMQNLAVTPEQIAAFMNQGGLGGPGGTQ
jgi:uncharacterized protein YgiM (DUF1202 family)